MEKYTVTEEYAKDMVGRLLGGFDKETVAQLVDQGMKKTDPLEVHSYFVELLGESEPVFRFVEEFNRKRFSSKKLEKSKAEKWPRASPQEEGIVGHQNGRRKGGGGETEEGKDTSQPAGRRG